MPKSRSNHNVIVIRDGIELGMLSEPEVQELLAAGFLRSTDILRREGSPEDQPLGELLVRTEQRDEKQPWLKQTAQSISSATGALTSKAGDLTGKITSFVSVKRTALTEGTRRVLEDYIPEIRKLVTKQLITKPALAINSAMQNDELMRKVFGAAHDCLPKPIRRFVPESSFVEFCLQNKKKLGDFKSADDKQAARLPQTNEVDKPSN
jgi:hypothetical protein